VAYFVDAITSARVAAILSTFDDDVCIATPLSEATLAYHSEMAIAFAKPYRVSGNGPASKSTTQGASASLLAVVEVACDLWAAQVATPASRKVAMVFILFSLRLKRTY